MTEGPNDPPPKPWIPSGPNVATILLLLIVAGIQIYILFQLAALDRQVKNAQSLSIDLAPSYGNDPETIRRAAEAARDAARACQRDAAAAASAAGRCSSTRPYGY